MKYVIIFLLFWGVVVYSTIAHSHEFTPTYPKMKPSFVEKVSVTKMKLFNKRNDAKYYQISVWDANWNPIKFASQNRIVEVDYLQTKHFEVYIRDKDLGRAKYICTESKLISGDVISTGIASRICSKIQR